MLPDLGLPFGIFKTMANSLSNAEWQCWRTVVTTVFCFSKLVASDLTDDIEKVRGEQHKSQQVGRPLTDDSLN